MAKKITPEYSHGLNNCVNILKRLPNFNKCFFVWMLKWLWFVIKEETNADILNEE